MNKLLGWLVFGLLIAILSAFVSKYFALAILPPMIVMIWRANRRIGKLSKR